MMFHCIVAVFANAYTITPSLAGLCGLDPKIPMVQKALINLNRFGL